MNNFSNTRATVAFHDMPTIALLIDADNLPASSYDMILKKLEGRGNLCIQRIYANWQKPHMNAWSRQVTEGGLTAVQQFDHLSGKNSSDIALCIDAVDLLHTHQIDVFCIASSDGDFSPLCLRLREYGKYVIGIGKPNSSKSLVNACNEFQKLSIDLSDKQTAAQNGFKPRVNGPDPNKNPYLLSLIRTTLAEQGQQGMMSLAQLGDILANDPQLPVDIYRVSSMDELIKQINNIEVFYHNGQAFVRDRYDYANASSYRAPKFMAEEEALVNVISNAIAQYQKAGWAKLSEVERYMRANFGMDYRQLGYNSLLELVDNLTQFQTHKSAGMILIADVRLGEPAKPKPFASAMPQILPGRTAVPREQLQANPALVKTLATAVSLHAGADDWAKLASIGALIKKRGINPHHFGYQNLKSLMMAVGHYEFQTIAGTYCVRIRPEALRLTSVTPLVVDADVPAPTVDEQLLQKVQQLSEPELDEQLFVEEQRIKARPVDADLADVDLADEWQVSEDDNIEESEEGGDDIEADDLTPMDSEMPVSSSAMTQQIFKAASVIRDYDEEELIEIQRLESLINQAIHALAEPHVGPSEYVEDGGEWANQEAIENFIYQDLDISSKDYDCATYPEFLEALNHFEQVQQGNDVWVKAQLLDVKDLKRLTALFRDGIKQTKQKKGAHKGWAKIGDIGSYARAKGVTSKQYGYTTFKDLLACLDGFSVKKVGRGSWVKLADGR